MHTALANRNLPLTWKDDNQHLLCSPDVLFVELCTGASSSDVDLRQLRADHQQVAPRSTIKCASAVLTKTPLLLTWTDTKHIGNRPRVAVVIVLVDARLIAAEDLQLSVVHIDVELGRRTALQMLSCHDIDRK